MDRVRGRVAIVTGAASGIGAASAQVLAGKEPESSSPTSTKPARRITLPAW